MNHSFFALISRLRAIQRWGLMRNSLPENVQEHSHMVAVLAHALALIRRDIFLVPCDPERCAALALFHDASEILTGDLPTPIKYFNGEITAAYKQLEALAEARLADCLPEELHSAYAELLSPGERDRELLPLVKAADKLCAYIKCVEERKAGNLEFTSAERQTLAAVEEMALPEADYFAEHFLPAFELNLDELRTIG